MEKGGLGEIVLLAPFPDSEFHGGKFGEICNFRFYGELPNSARYKLQGETPTLEEKKIDSQTHKVTHIFSS